MHAHRRFRALAEDRGDGRGARSRTRRLSFADTALEETDFNIFAVKHFYKFNIDPMLEVVMLADLRTLGLPTDREFVDENGKVRIAHGNRNSANFAESHLDKELVANLRFTHSSLKLKTHVSVRGQRAGLDPGSGANRDFLPGSFGAEIGCDAAGAIAGDFRFPTIGIQQASADVGILRGKEPFHTIGADAIVAVANRTRERNQIGRGMHAVNDEKVIAAGAGLGKWNCRHSA